MDSHEESLAGPRLVPRTFSAPVTKNDEEVLMQSHTMLIGKASIIARHKDGIEKDNEMIKWVRVMQFKVVYFLDQRPDNLLNTIFDDGQHDETVRKDIEERVSSWKGPSRSNGGGRNRSA